MKKIVTKMIAMLMVCICIYAPPDMEVYAATLTSSSIQSYVLDQVGNKYGNGYCLRFVEECYQNLGGARPYNCCASNSGNNYIIDTNSSNIPIGATVYFGNCGGGPCSRCGSAYYGHVGIYVGDGYFVHASGGRVQKSTLSSWSNKYRGWGYCGNFTLVEDLNKPTATYAGYTVGTSNSPTTIYWNKAENASVYDVKIWMGTFWNGEPYKAVWGVEGTSCQVVLPAGYYEAYVDSRNDHGVAMSNVIKFTVPEAEQPVTNTTDNPQSGNNMFGDIDNNGRITASDLSVLKMIADGAMTPTEDQKLRADVDGDGKITQKDVALVNSFILGEITSFPIEKLVGTTFITGSYKYIITSGTTVALAGLKNRNTTIVPVFPKVTYNGKSYQVTAVADGAFKNTTLKAINLPNSVKSIGANAFEGCKDLRRVTLGTGITVIGAGAFKDTYKKMTVVIPSGKYDTIKALLDGKGLSDEVTYLKRK